MSVRHLFNPSGLVRRQLTISPITPHLLPSFPAANSLFSRSYPAFTRRPPRDEEIGSLCHDIRFIDAAGKFQGIHPLESILSMMDRENYHLVSINPHVAPEPVICRLVSKLQLEEDERAAYLAKKMKKQSSKNPSKTVKTIEISWATAPNDLGHKMKKINEFLQKGYRVDVVLGVKKGMAKQPLGRMEELVERIKSELEKNGNERKPSEGKVGVQYMIYLEGIRQKKKAEEPRLVEGTETEKQVSGVEVAGEPEAGVETKVMEDMNTVRSETESMDSLEETGSREERKEI